MMLCVARSSMLNMITISDKERFPEPILTISIEPEMEFPPLLSNLMVTERSSEETDPEEAPFGVDEMPSVPSEVPGTTLAPAPVPSSSGSLPKMRTPSS